MFYPIFFTQLQKVERKLQKTGNENLNKRYKSIYDELKRLDLILYKVWKSSF